MLHSGRPHVTARRRPGRLASLLAALALVTLVISACGPTATDEDDRRFANDTPPPRATPAMQGSPVTSRRDGPPVPIAATPDLAGLLSSPAVASSAFFLLDGRLLIAGVDGIVTAAALAGPVSALSVAPAGDRAAVLVEAVAGTATPLATPDQSATPASVGGAASARSLVIVGGDGAVIRTIDDLDATLAEQPEIGETMSGGDAAVAVAIGPTADDLLVAFPDGLLVRLLTGGAVTVVPGSGNLADLRQVSWSPDGGSLAIVAADAADGMPAVFYTALRADGIDPVRVAPAPGRTTGDVAWLPDSRGLVFVDATGPVGAETLRAGRDLFLTPLRTDRRTLVAAAGIIGPGAGVVAFAVNPNGESVAYTLYRAEGADARFNSLWVGGIDGRSPSRLTLPDGVGVSGLAWTSAGLLVLTAPAADGAAQALLVEPDGVARPAADAGATPAA